MKRFIRVLAVAALMAVMLMAMAAPAFAFKCCSDQDPPRYNYGYSGQSATIYHCEEHYGAPYKAGTQVNNSGEKGSSFNCQQ
jgi:hypothetical protein